jgi:hypothetical protein
MIYQYIIEITTQENITDFDKSMIPHLQDCNNQLLELCQGVVDSVTITANPNNPITK